MLGQVEACWGMLGHVGAGWGRLGQVEACWGMLRHVEACWGNYEKLDNKKINLQKSCQALEYLKMECAQPLCF